MAAILADQGYFVSLYDIDKDLVQSLQEKECIELTGRINISAKPELITGDIKEAVKDADVIMVVTTGDAHETVAKAIKPYVKDGQIILLTPGQVGGALLMSAQIRSGENPPDVIIGESLDLFYACRKEENGRIFHSGIKESVLVSTIPASDIYKLDHRLHKVFPQITKADSALYTSLDCGGAILHVIPTLMNINLMDRKCTYDYYIEGITENIAILLTEADRERMKVCKELKADLPTLAEWMKDCYHLEGGDIYELIQKNAAYIGVKPPENLEHRFIKEEVQTGFVPMAAIAKALGIDTPVINAFIKMAQLFTGTDYEKVGRTAEKLGIAGMNAEEIRKYIAQ